MHRFDNSFTNQFCIWISPLPEDKIEFRHFEIINRPDLTCEHEFSVYEIKHTEIFARITFQYIIKWVIVSDGQFDFL